MICVSGLLLLMNEKKEHDVYCISSRPYDRQNLNAENWQYQRVLVGKKQIVDDTVEDRKEFEKTFLVVTYVKSINYEPILLKMLIISFLNFYFRNSSLLLVSLSEIELECLRGQKFQVVSKSRHSCTTMPTRSTAGFLCRSMPRPTPRNTR